MINVNYNLKLHELVVRLGDWWLDKWGRFEAIIVDCRVIVPVTVELFSYKIFTWLYATSLPLLSYLCFPLLLSSSLRALVALAQRCQPVCPHFPRCDSGSWGLGRCVCFHTPHYITHTHIHTPHSQLAARLESRRVGQGWQHPQEGRALRKEGGEGTGWGGKRGWVDRRLGSQTARCCQLTSPIATGL